LKPPQFTTQIEKAAEEINSKNTLKARRGISIKKESQNLNFIFLFILAKELLSFSQSLSPNFFDLCFFC
jgi:hypothetical protein